MLKSYILGFSIAQKREKKLKKEKERKRERERDRKRKNVSSDQEDDGGFDRFEEAMSDQKGRLEAYLTAIDAAIKDQDPVKTCSQLVDTGKRRKKRKWTFTCQRFWSK